MTLTDQVIEIGNRIERTGIRIKEALSVIDVTFDDRLHASSPYEAFAGLTMLIDLRFTGQGSRVSVRERALPVFTPSRFIPKKGRSLATSTCCI